MSSSIKNCDTMRFFDKLTNSGERPLVNTAWEDMNADLQFAYKVAAAKIAPDDRVLDYGCGGGYGTEYLSRFTKNVTEGYDPDAATIRKNRSFFKDKPGIRFCHEESELTRYDMIVFFQVVEHLRLQDIPRSLEKIKGLLTERGTCFIATVNKNISSYKLKKPILPFHVYEFNSEELAFLLKRYFCHVTSFGQIEAETLKQVRAGAWSYREDFNRGLRNKILRVLSQVEFVRMTARHTPLFIKDFLLGQRKPHMKQPDFRITEDPWEIENSYILIYECRQ